MLDGFTTTMREHVANCYQARGLSSAGSEQLANNQTPTKPSDQAMIGTKNRARDVLYGGQKQRCRERFHVNRVLRIIRSVGSIGSDKDCWVDSGAAKGPAAPDRQAATVAQAVTFAPRSRGGPGGCVRPRV